MGEIVVSILQLFWEYPGFMLRVLLGVIVARIAWLALRELRDRVRMWWDFRTRGWAVDPFASDVEYREVVGGRPESLRFRTEWVRIDSGTSMRFVHLPNQAQWDRVFPVWIRGRFEEIVARLRSRLDAEDFSLRFE